MVTASEVLYYAVHFQELRSIIQWKTWHTAVHERDEEKESPSVRKCFYYLDMTSRSFSAVIQELHPELLFPIMHFYLILRGLDTIEDDMTLSNDVKVPLLRDFYQKIEEEGWTFDGSGPDEKDRDLLVHFDVVIGEFLKMKPVYRDIIRDITQKMGGGMADYCEKPESLASGLKTVEEYDLYCHYVAGLVGNGLTRLFVESGLANPALLKRPQLQESMGLFLQKTNIIRDIKEDFDDNRRFWPKVIWSKHVDKFEDLFKPEYRTAALNCNSEMVLNALYHADECLFYLAGIKEQSVFNFAAIPQAMAIATLELVFRNPKMFRQHIKLTRGESCRIMTKSTQNLQVLCEVFKEFTRKIHQKNTPRDPNFLKISIQCGKIEQFIESIFPTQDPQTITAEIDAQPTPAQTAEARNAEMVAEAKKDTIFILASVIGVLIFISAIMIGVAWYFGARFDITVDELRKGNFRPVGADPAESVKQKFDRGEL